MGAPKGNRFWKQRSKHGRDKLFATPDLLLEAAFEYFEWCDRNPWMKKEVAKSGPLAGNVFDVPTERPYSLTGLCLYLGASEEYWREFRKAGHKEFFGVISRIENIIETQQFEGATVGAFNANIISRKLGLAEKNEHTGPDGGDIRLSHKIEDHKVIFEHYRK